MARDKPWRNRIPATAKAAPIGGTFSVTVSSASNGSNTISFPAGTFTAAPRVVACVDGTFFNWYATVGSISTSGATVSIAERNSVNGTGTITGFWIAVAQ